VTGGFRRISERSVHQGRVIDVAVATVEGPDGTTFERDIVHSPGAVAVVAVDDDGRVTLVRQYRVALDDELLELPAGMLDIDGEDPDECARRELAEEVGLEAGQWRRLCVFYNAAGSFDQRTIVYLAQDLSPVPSDRQGPEEAAMTIEHVDLADATRLVMEGTVHDAKTCIGLLLARDVLAAS
jgi:ADP-ribose pyrophosphatase